MSIEELEHIIEAILFANGDVISVKSIANATDNDEKTIKTIINNLSDKYRDEKRGISIIQVGDGYQMCTNEEYYEYIRKIYNAPAALI